MGDSPAAIPFNSAGTEIGTATDPVRVDPTGDTDQPVSGTVTVEQDTAASLKATVYGPGTAGSPDAGVVTVQGITSGTAVPVSMSPTSNPTNTTGDITSGSGSTSYVTVATQGYESCAVVITGTWVATLVFECSSDGGTTWFYGALVGAPTTPPPVPSLNSSVTANGSYGTIGMGATTNIRIRASAYTSGTAAVRIVLSGSPSSMPATFAQIQQNVYASTLNSSAVNLAAQAAFAGTSESTLGIAGIQVNVYSDQPITVVVSQSIDGTNWDIQDTWDILARESASRTFQATASYYKISATNVGNATTNPFRLQTCLCPVVEALPRALTKNGKLSVASITTGIYPWTNDRQDRTQTRALLMDKDRNLRTRGVVLTDQGGFRDDFTNASTYYTDISGTVYFTNGQTYVTATGSAFTTQLRVGEYLKKSDHADTAYAKIAEIYNDTHLRLSTNYAGATANGTGRLFAWEPSIGTNGTITVSGTNSIILTAPTDSGTLVRIRRLESCAPAVFAANLTISARVANQNIRIGFFDADSGSEVNQAIVIFDGTTNTTCIFRTGSNATSTNCESTTVTLPAAGTTAAAHTYTIELQSDRVFLYIDDFRCAEHKLHFPAGYTELYYGAMVKNTAGSTSTTTTIDSISMLHYNRLQIGSFAKGDVLPVRQVRSNIGANSSVAAAASDTSLLAANANRMGATIYNDGVATLYLLLGITAASVTNYTVQVPKDGYYEVPYYYTGAIRGIWSSATGNARITEIT